jgi:hypothetical protein
MKKKTGWLIAVLFLGMVLGTAPSMAYDPTAQPGFLGPEVVSGPDEPSIPGGAFTREKYALADGGGMYIDGQRAASIIHDQAVIQMLPDGRCYIVDKSLQTIFYIKDDRMYKLAGSGIRGDRDGPAETAQFCFGQYFEAIGGLAMAPDSSIYITDNKNNKVKKLYKNASGRWYVKTVAGGGTKTLQPYSPGPGDTCIALQAKLGGGIGSPSFCGPNKDHLYFKTGKDDWEWRYMLCPNGTLKCVGYAAGTADLPYGFSETGYAYGFSFAGGSWATVCMKTSRANGSRTKVVGYTDAEIAAKLAANPSWQKPVDGPVDDCTFWTTGGPMRPDGRAIYTIGGDELNIRRVMNGRVTTLNTSTGAWFESRTSRYNSIGCMSIFYLDWEGYAYMTWAYGGSGIHRAKLYAPLTKPAK